MLLYVLWYMSIVVIFYRIWICLFTVYMILAYIIMFRLLLPVCMCFQLLHLLCWRVAWLSLLTAALLLRAIFSKLLHVFFCSRRLQERGGDGKRGDGQIADDWQIENTPWTLLISFVLELLDSLVPVVWDSAKRNEQPKTRVVWNSTREISALHRCIWGIY